MSLPASLPNDSSSPSRVTPPRESRLWMLVVGSLLMAAGYAVEPTAQNDGGDDGGINPPTVNQQQPLSPAVLGNADSNNRMIAVTGVDITGSAILYVIDTLNPHIAVYQANGGSKGTQSIKLVAARNIGLDLQLDGLNDRSEFTFSDLEERFAKRAEQ